MSSETTFTMPDEPVEVTANWTAINYTITVEQGGGKDSSADLENATIGQTVHLTRGTREGYTFLGWHSDEVLTIAYNVLGN